MVRRSGFFGARRRCHLALAGVLGAVRRHAVSARRRRLLPGGISCGHCGGGRRGIGRRSVRTRLPLQRSDTAVRADERRLRRVGEAEIEFTVASDAAVGVFECCSLFSPMFEFAHQASAVATAQCALDELRQAVPAAQAPATLLERPARRSFLFGRQGGEQ